MLSITCEKPETWLWEQLALYENETLAKRYLEKTYAQNGIDQPRHEAFKNTDAFCAYLRQGRFFFQAVTPHTEQTAPLMLYYGLINLIKSILLSCDPSYPQHTGLLQHGCSTRKRKRQSYQLFYDEIRIQKEGLFPYMLKKLYDLSPIEKIYPPKYLFGQLPDLQMLYRHITKQQTLYRMSLLKTSTGLKGTVSEAILDRLHLTLSAWVRRFHRFAPEHVKITEATCQEGKIHFIFSVDEVTHLYHPLLLKDMKAHIYLWLDPEFASYRPLPELAVAYLLLFAFSMLVRYDPPLWQEMWHTSAESALLSPFFSWVKRKIPQIILELIWGKPLLLHVQ